MLGNKNCRDLEFWYQSHNNWQILNSYIQVHHEHLNIAHQIQHLYFIAYNTSKSIYIFVVLWILHFPTGLCYALQIHSQKANTQTISCSLEMGASFTKVERNWGAQTTTVLLLINICTQIVSHLGPKQVSGTPQHRCDAVTRSEMVGSCTGAWTVCATGLHYWLKTLPALCRRLYLLGFAKYWSDF